MQPACRRVLFLALLLAMPLAAPAGAGSLTTSATIRNADPTIETFQALLDPRLGFFVYEVHAKDRNGAPDLDRAIFHLTDRNGHLHAYADHSPTVEGGRAVWRGTTPIGLHLADAPFRVHLHVYDRSDAQAEAEAPVTPLSPIVDATDDAVPAHSPSPAAAPLPPLLRLQSVDAVLPAPQLALVLTVALLLAAVVALAAYRTRRR